MEGLEYGVSLKDQMSGPAENAAKSLQDLAGAMTHAKGGLSELTHGFVKVVEPTEVMKGALEGIGAGFKSLANGIKNGEVKEAVAGVTETLAGLSTMLDLVIPGLGQAASALIKVAGGVVGIIAGLAQEGMKLAIEATQGKQAMISLFAALGGGQAIGEQTEEMLSDLSAQIGITKDELAPLTKQFMVMGYEGEEALKRLTLAAVSAKAITGDAGAQAFVSLTEKIKLASDAGHGLKIPEKGLKALFHAGASADDVAKRLGVSTKTLMSNLKAGTQDAKAFGDAFQDALINKGQTPLARMGSSMANLKKMVGQSFEDMFEDMGKDVDPLLAQVKDLFKIFDSSRPVGQTMKSAIGGTMTHIFKQMTQIVPLTKHFFQYVILYSLQAYNALAPLRKLMSFMRQDSDAPSGLTKSLSFLGLVARATGDQMVGQINTLTMWVTVSERVVGAVSSLGSAVWESIKGWGLPAEQAAHDFVMGLVNGIGNGVSDVVKAAGSLGQSALTAIRGIFQSHSPSMAMFNVGIDAGDGLTGGLDKSKAKATTAGASLGSAAMVGAAAGVRDIKPESMGANSKSAPMGPITIVIQAKDGVTNALELTEAAVAVLFERFMLHTGG